jgi:tRNA pseudouridine38-40 synthase
MAVSTGSRVAVKLAYDGARFYGYQRQPGRRTVEGDLLDALVRLGAIESARSAGFRSSSRTDRGVSALGNVVSFRTGFSLGGLCSAVNSEVEDVWAYSVAAVPGDFNPRWARERWYRYYLPKRGQDIAPLRERFKRFEGTHDFSGFSRKDDRNPLRTIDSIEVGDAPGFYVVDLRAESFLWNMVRRIVWMVDASCTGEVDERRVGPDAGQQPRRVGLAPAEYLLLMDVDCGVEFEVDRRCANRLKETFRGRLEKCLMEQAYSRHLLEALEP